jgi:gliding motility-associated-like protein
MKSFWIGIVLVCAWASGALAQNLVPNPSFEDMNDCDLVLPELFCSQHWAEYLDLDFGNTPDLGYEGAQFFPPSTIDAYDGDQYLNIECSMGNPEYIQIDLIEALTAGTSYCVSFYASLSQESNEVAPSLGAYFTDAPLTNSPFELGIAASVQGPVDFDPTSWTLISGTYVAQGGESMMVFSGFENTGTMPFPYMYIDMVSVVPMPDLVLDDQEWCEAPVVIDAFANGATYSWSSGHTTSSIEVNEPGTYTVLRTLEVCTQQASAEVLECTDTPVDPEDPIDPKDPVDPDSTENDGPTVGLELVFFVPNAFTPDGDGSNDIFGAVGPQTDAFLLQIFNRWGEMVYESKQVDQRWTGNHQGGEYFVPDGVYVYRLSATNEQSTVQFNGHVLLMR